MRKVTGSRIEEALKVSEPRCLVEHRSRPMDAVWHPQRRTTPSADRPSDERARQPVRARSAGEPAVEIGLGAGGELTAALVVQPRQHGGRHPQVLGGGVDL